MKVKEKKVEGGVPEGMSARDLSVEKRIELFQEAFVKFQKESGENLGMGLGCKIAYTPQAAIPCHTAVDLLKKQNEQTNQEPKS